jgi:choline dehydrogenase-like flavoprotein
MLPRLYHDGASRTTADRAIHVHQGKGVGGSTLHNINLCARLPEPVFARWRAEQGLSALPPETLAALYDEVSARHAVSLLGEKDLNGNNRVFKRGVEELGWRGGFLHHNRVGCAGSGFCELGCPFDAKQNALKVSIAQAVDAGAVVLADTWAARLRHDGRRATAVEAVVRDPASGATLARVVIRARAVCVSASATATPALLQRSDVPDPFRLVGSRLHLHPGLAVAADFGDELRSWSGIPQSYECTELLDFAARRVWLVPAFAHPAGVSSILGAVGAAHGRILARYPHLAAATAMVDDTTHGTVRPRGAFGVELDYTLGKDDAVQLADGIRALTRIFLAAGAARVHIPLARPVEVERGADLDTALAALEVRPHGIDLTAVHPMASVWMGDDPARSCVDARGRYHHVDNLYVADTSLFPTSIGVPPQLTAFALGTHVGRQIAAAL